MCRRVLYWYYLYMNHPGGNSIVNTTRILFHKKGLVMQAEISVNTRNKCQKFKKRKTINGKLPPNNTAVLKPWN